MAGAPQHEYPKRDFRFWMAILCLSIASFLVSLDLCGIITALPTIVNDLHGEEFEWVASAFALAATALLPFTGALAQVFGRRFTMLVHLVCFSVGSAVCGSAKTLNWLIGGRVVQGIGSGGFTSMSQIVISDLVPLHERGIFNAMVALAYGVAAAISPTIAGLLAQHGAWRWFFYMNIPICGVAAVLAVLFLNFESPRATLKEKIFAMDWGGNFLVIASSAAAIIALTWGGIQFPWGSWHILVPLVLGLVGVAAFIMYDKFVPRNPLVPFKVLTNLEAISGYIQGFFGNVFMMCMFYFIPVYTQACRGASPTHSGVLLLPCATLMMPSGIVASIVIAKTGKYRPQLWLAWVLMMAGSGLLATLTADMSNSHVAGLQLIASIGMGIILVCAVFPVLAPITVDLNPQALSFFMFIRFFAQSFGVAVGGTILQNQLKTRLPADFLSQFPQGTAIAYSIIPTIRELDEPFQHEVRVAFADSLRILWFTMIAINGAGFLASLLMKGLSLKLGPPPAEDIVELPSTSPTGTEAKLTKSRSSEEMA